jgi:hypothetical protein
VLPEGQNWRLALGKLNMSTKKTAQKRAEKRKIARKDLDDKFLKALTYDKLNSCPTSLVSDKNRIIKRTKTKSLVSMAKNHSVFSYLLDGDFIKIFSFFWVPGDVAVLIEQKFPAFIHGEIVYFDTDLLKFFIIQKEKEHAKLRMIQDFYKVL